MGRLSEEDIQKMQVQTATVTEDPPGVFWHNQYPQDKFDNRKEAWYNAITKNEAKRLEAAGLDNNGQTPTQKKVMEAKRKVQEERKRKAELAAEMASQNR